MNAEQIKDLSMLDVAEQILKERKEAISIYELLDEVAQLKGISPDDTDSFTQLYMDITLSGKFVFVGEGQWALKDGNLDFWDKDGYAFVQPGEEDDHDEDDLDFTEFTLGYEAEEDEDLDDVVVDEEEKEEKEYIEMELPAISTDDDDLEDIGLDLDDDYDEDDYNDIMDDYEDMYDE